ncbi:sensor histidine kinase [Pedobacter sp. L105]|uniref:sensor histidine kinase n=1 Tax=Pedobacter sp. L105 TaxID=1641871 RepID=UPI00131B6036|nr:histidine kinase [Pedobacter sp. L105]
MSLNNQSASYKTVFKVSPSIIWLSSLFIGMLAAIPKILLINITLTELAVDASIAFTFSLVVWYTNLYNLPKFTSQPADNSFFNRKLLFSLLIGIVVMIVLVLTHMLIFPRYKFQSMMLMYQFRGILINLTIYMFLHLLYHSYSSQLMGIELERTKADNLGAQFELLKQQVNPHFLFNSLSTLKSMIEIGDPHSADFINQLSDFYRFTLEKRKSDLISLAEELNILEAYTYLLKARFEDGIDLNITIDNNYQQSYIPPFTLQLLLENCIKHNIVSLEQPLPIRLYISGDSLVIENKLQLRKKSEFSTEMGLENINQRYIHLISKKVEIESGTTSFKVKLPIIYERPNY